MNGFCRSWQGGKYRTVIVISQHVSYFAVFSPFTNILSPSSIHLCLFPSPIFCRHPPFFCHQDMYAHTHAPFCDTPESIDKWDVMVCSLHHPWQTSVPQTFSLSLICSSDTERKVDILVRDWICTLAPWLATLSSSSQCSSSYYLAFAVVGTMPARSSWVTLSVSAGVCQLHLGFP